MDMIGWLARYEVTVRNGTVIRSFRFFNRRDVRWALWFGHGVLAETSAKVSARDRWTGRAVG